MARLHFSLVSPERELFSGEVDQVDAPGTEGDFGVLAGHAPFMTTLKPGFVFVYDQSVKRAFEIQGGFADVTPAGLTILAEHAEETPERVATH
ncbi:MAG: ATP synthase F1 subunit epsilon [Proteobacteria bacterium]|nr:ATP synthase F1 subunit epsilon [Pseudomonadota bacterium]